MSPMAAMKIFVKTEQHRRGRPSLEAQGRHAILDSEGHLWRSEQVDLREVYRHIWPDEAPAHLIDIAIFCDSDETHGHTVSYFADVKLRRWPY
jgi:Protein of unknown function (DUF3047)